MNVPPVFDYSADANTYGLNDYEFLVGDFILSAPVYNEGASTRTVYLPYAARRGVVLLAVRRAQQPAVRRQVRRRPDGHRQRPAGQGAPVRAVGRDHPHGAVHAVRQPEPGGVDGHQLLAQRNQRVHAARGRRRDVGLPGRRVQPAPDGQRPHGRRVGLHHRGQAGDVQHGDAGFLRLLLQPRHLGRAGRDAERIPPRPVAQLRRGRSGLADHRRRPHRHQAAGYGRAGRAARELRQRQRHASSSPRPRTRPRRTRAAFACMRAAPARPRAPSARASPRPTERPPRARITRRPTARSSGRPATWRTSSSTCPSRTTAPTRAARRSRSA